MIWVVISIFVLVVTVNGLPVGFFLFKFPKLVKFLMRRWVIFLDGDYFIFKLLFEHSLSLLKAFSY